MKESIGKIVAVAAIAASNSASAEVSAKGIDPMQAHTLALADRTADVYYVGWASTLRH